MEWIEDDGNKAGDERARDYVRLWRGRGKMGGVCVM